MITPIKHGGKLIKLGTGGVVAIPSGSSSWPSKITIIGNKFYMNGRQWKGVGFQGQQPLTHQDEIDGLTAVGPAYNSGETNRNKFRKHLGANFTRQYGHQWALLQGDSFENLEANPVAMDNLMQHVLSAAEQGISSIITSNNTWLGSVGVPAWYDAYTDADETERWAVQQFCLESIVQAVVDRGYEDFVLGYELISEPAITIGGTYYGLEWEDSGLFYVPNVSIKVGADNTDAAAWATQMVSAIKAIDPNALTTIGQLTIKSNGKPSIGGPFGLANMDSIIDFHSPHISPLYGLVQNGIEGTLDWAYGTSKPVIIGENHAIGTLNYDENVTFVKGVAPHLSGIMGFAPYYDGSDVETWPDRYTMPTEIANGTEDEQLAWNVQWAGAAAISDNADFIKGLV